MKLLIMNSYYFQTHSPGKVTATEGVAFGPSCIYCGPNFLGASMALVDGQNLHPQGMGSHI